MTASLLSCAATAKFSAKRNCFLSLPQAWVKSIIPSTVHVFLIENSAGTQCYASWSGETHKLDYDLEPTIELNNQLLSLNGLADGEAVSVRQVATPAPYEKLSVSVASLDDWDAIALNRDTVQLEFLEQVRVVYSEQCIPLWLQGGMCVSLKVISMAPAAVCGLLLPLTYVEVIPPSSEGNASPLESTAFATSLPTYQSQNDLLKEQETLSKVDSSHASSVLEMLAKSVAVNLVKCHQIFLPASNANGRFSLRVTPMPQNSFPVSSVFIISREVLKNSRLIDKVFIFSKIIVHQSTKSEDNSTECNKKEANLSTKENCISGSGPSIFYTMALVWENYKMLQSNDLTDELRKALDAQVFGHYVLVPDAVRRRLQLKPAAIVTLQTGSFSLRTFPSTIDIFPVTATRNYNDSVLIDSIIQEFCTQCELCDIVLNDRSLYQIKVDSTTVDVLVSLRNKTPLVLTRQSAPLLNITVISSLSAPPPYLPRSTSQLDSRKQITKGEYVGDLTLRNNLKTSVIRDLGLSRSRVSCPKFALIVGEAASGKTFLVRSLASELELSPYYIWTEVVSCKQLIGKKAETVEKKLLEVVRRACNHRPSVIVLEDLDFLCPATEEESGVLFDHHFQLMSVFTGLLDRVNDLNERTTEGTESIKFGNVIVLATCISRESVCDDIVSLNSSHYFAKTFKIPNVTPAKRVQAFKKLVTNCLGIHPRETPSSSSLLDVDIPIKRVINLDIDESSLLKLTEGCKLPDLDNLAKRTTSVVRHRLETVRDEQRQPQATWTARHILFSIDQETKSSSKDHFAGTSLTVTLQDLTCATTGYTPIAYKG